MGRLMDAIFNKLQNKRGKNAEDDIYHMHHTMMKEYGWIPLDEFKALPMQTVNDLIHEINKDRKTQNKAAKKQRRRGKR